MTTRGIFCIVSIALACSAGAPVSRAQAPAATEAREITKQVTEAFRFGDFPQLERLYALYGRPGLRATNGVPTLRRFWYGIDNVSDSNLKVSEQYFVQLDALTRKWALDHPESGLAQLLHVYSLETHASFFRGSGYANTVSDASWREYRKYLQLALEQLQRSEALLSRDGSWSLRLLHVGRGLGWSQQQLMAVFENGVARDPEYDDLYDAMELALLPKWGGDIPTVERFIADVTQRTKQRRGMEMYARLYANLSDWQVKQSLFTATRASWPTMKAGYEDRLSRYPHMDTRNFYAYYACMAKDTVALVEQLNLIGDKFNRDQWGDTPEKTFEECKSLAART